MKNIIGIPRWIKPSKTTSSWDTPKIPKGSPQPALISLAKPQLARCAQARAQQGHLDVLPVMPSDPNVNVDGPQSQGSEVESLGSKQA